MHPPPGHQLFWKFYKTQTRRKRCDDGGLQLGGKRLQVPSVDEGRIEDPRGIDKSEAMKRKLDGMGRKPRNIPEMKTGSATPMLRRSQVELGMRDESIEAHIPGE